MQGRRNGESRGEPLKSAGETAKSADIRGVLPRPYWCKLCVAVVGSSVVPRRAPLVTAMQQIADWLKKLGMSEYAERFAENRIDLSVLPDLTDQHLEKLGVALGDRLKILRAIRDIGNTSVAVAAPSAPSTPPVAGRSPRRPSANDCPTWRPCRAGTSYCPSMRRPMS